MIAFQRALSKFRNQPQMFDYRPIRLRASTRAVSRHLRDAEAGYPQRVCHEPAEA
jgi:hypothetical protein